MTTTASSRPFRPHFLQALLHSPPSLLLWCTLEPSLHYFLVRFHNSVVASLSVRDANSFPSSGRPSVTPAERDRHQDRATRHEDRSHVTASSRRADVASRRADVNVNRRGDVDPLPPITTRASSASSRGSAAPSTAAASSRTSASSSSVSSSRGVTPAASSKSSAPAAAAAPPRETPGRVGELDMDDFLPVRTFSLSQHRIFFCKRELVSGMSSLTSRQELNK